ncbi:MAG: cation diffusion facilitator family transporter, partial [Bacilli bacterium]|nr:cation diffusion facilitator family transporter [Bacilli bacterium]
MNKSSKVMITSLLTNAFLVVIKIIFGLIGKSGALIVDAVHSLSDLATDLFSIVGIKLSSKPADKKHPYGHGRLEYLTSIGIGLIIGIVGIYIIYNSVNRKVVIPKTFILYILFFDIIVKLILSRYIIRKGKEYKNNILISSGHESKMDVLSTGIVILSTILVQFV